MSSVLVTGGAGYIGSHVVLALVEAGYTPVVLDDLSTGVREAVPAGVAFHQGDAGDRTLLARLFADHGITAIVHFAGSIVVPESIADPAKYYRNNTATSLALTEAALAAGVRWFIFSSTAAVYGAPAVPAVSEDDPTVPINPYGASKLMTEWMLRDLAAARPDFRPVRLRYFNVAGADPRGRTGQRGPQSTHLIRVAIETALGQRPVLPVFGDDYDTRDGSCERDFIHVSDLAEAHVAALRYLQAGGAPEVFNCGYGRGYTVLEVIACLEGLIGRPLRVERAPRRPGDPPRLLANADRIRERLDWRPRYAELDRILEDAMAWQEKTGIGASKG